ncbi:MAG: cupredoxin domain-containing protein [Armatimonadota bacterium]|nr:cupredoxin domain-containing protein [Armatimonadota bacterium]MDR7401810.1 cupredoxin domain-containing protein [Armatimonadota bacterium]MDR7403112.1 cupredoxin domain-containing protein [Armatimonadota bacterium]MDR7438157.1 cupredoxin domain-containing protein [Armatimonadota bacterium]MDR7471435.1 cupredoxin domain-containing protein [Armatimonadota bacterium]
MRGIFRWALGIGLILTAAAGRAQAPPAPRLVRILLEEYRFVPDRVTLKAGETVRLELVNTGTVTHQFRSEIFRGIDVFIRTAGFDVRSERVEVIWIRPRAAAVVEFARRTPGEYRFWCSERTDGVLHRELGMEGRFVVIP